MYNDAALLSPFDLSLQLITTLQNGVVDCNSIIALRRLPLQTVNI